MKQFFRRHKKRLEIIEHYNSKLIPLAIICLLGIIVIELFIHIENHNIELAVHIVDYIVISIFAIDLFFLALKAKTTSFFFKRYWLDVLAIFPFGLLFKSVERITQGVIATERIVIGQAIAHETIEVKKEVSAVVRSGRALRTIRIVARLLRIITKSHIFTLFQRKHKLAHHRVYRTNLYF